MNNLQKKKKNDYKFVIIILKNMEIKINTYLIL